MHTTTIAFLIAVGLFATSSFAEDARPVRGERQWLSIPQVHAKLEAAGYRNVEKIEREHGGYEIKATDRDGQRVKLYLNPQTGDILDQRRKRDKYDRSDKGDSRNSADCNERRCRDDLPRPGVTTAPTGK
jgi:hypothetical protein